MHPSFIYVTAGFYLNIYIYIFEGGGGGEL